MFPKEGLFTARALAVAAAVALLSPAPAGAIPPPRERGARTVQPPPDSDRDWGFVASARAAAENRLKQKSAQGDPWEIMQQGISVRGTRTMAVLPMLYKNSAQEPVSVADLQRNLFDGPVLTGTLTDYFREVSYRTFTVTGIVQPWHKVKEDDTYYEGADQNGEACKGLCSAALIQEAVRALVAVNDSRIDFTQLDNDGPDGRPNSGDDNGAVDFLLILQPEHGGECFADDRNIHSHHSVLDQPIATGDTGLRGTPIMVNSYVVAGALACGGNTAAPIGMIAHEIGHALDLPDLYDTRDENGKSSGIGEWGLMGLGAWGGDGDSPERPSHMSVWEKARLGWVQPSTVLANQASARLRPIEQWPEAFRINIDAFRYYLIEYRRPLGFDDRLPGSGLLVWEVNEFGLIEKIRTNTVNGNELRQGLELVEADLATPLDDEINPADLGDMFRGSANVRRFDRSTDPRARRGALCEIGEAEDVNAVSIYVTRARCPNKDRPGG
jgi:M6 family metalloprotease-like protein